MTHGQPSRPANVENIIAINQGRQPLSRELPALKALPVHEVMAAFASKQVHLIDIREYADYGACHITGSLNFQLASSEFEQRVGWLLSDSRDFVLISDHESDARQALLKLAFIGLDVRVAGYLVGGADVWEAAGGQTGRLPQLTPAELSAWLEKEILQVLDVRERDEYDEGHIAGAVNLSYKQIDDGFGGLGLDTDRTIVVTCAGGYRSSTASSVLMAQGIRNLVNLAGGMDAWKDNGLPVE